MLLNQCDAMLEFNTLQHNINIELFFLQYNVNICFFCIAIAQLTTSMHNATLTLVFFFFAKKSTIGNTVSNFWREYLFFSKNVRGINTKVLNTNSEPNLGLRTNELYLLLLLQLKVEKLSFKTV